MAAESRRALGVPGPQACSLHSEQETGQESQDGYPSSAEIKAFSPCQVYIVLEMKFLPCPSSSQGLQP
ncbi:hypothetical protein ACRRTK_012557 [Alexandromys fortis]